MSSCRLQWQVNLMGAFTFMCFIFNIFFLKLIMVCKLCVIYVREDDDSNI